MIRLWNFCSKNFSNVSRVTRREVRSSREFEIHKRDLETFVPSIIEVFKTSSDERTSLSRIFHGRKGRSLVLKTGATLFPCKGRRGSNEGTGETWNSPRGGKRRSSDYHNVIVCLDNRLVVYSSRGETAPPEESRVISSFPFLFSFSFLFFPSFFLSFSLDVCARKSFRVPSRSKRSFYYVPSIIPIISAYFFFFFPSTNVEEKSSSKENCCSKLSA